jgi:alkanesulfonate monooxygenase SsuD/methylene tetrahydromethanopterin reductase-like flavin-dependent oxidoreductase (luciferase family)
MLEAYAALAYIAGQTRQIQLGAMVTCVAYRHPGMLIKAVTSLDVLSGGRVVFGVGAGWDVEEARSLGIPFPPTGERFERLEELLLIAKRMWAGDESPIVGRHYQLARPLNSPNSLQRPHPPILIGGSGERRTLPLVAEHADACNFFDIPGSFAVDIEHKLDVLRSHCDAVGRDFASIEKSTITAFEFGNNRPAGLRALVDHIGRLGELGIDHVILIGPRFDWGDDLEAVLSIVDDIHDIVPVTAP